MVDMASSDIFYIEIVDNEGEEDGVPFVAPNDRGGGGMVVPRCIEARF